MQPDAVEHSRRRNIAGSVAPGWARHGSFRSALRSASTKITRISNRCALCACT
jgi:hypothetical protein